MKIKVLQSIFIAALAIVSMGSWAQQGGLVNTSYSPYAKLHPVGMEDVTWTNGFWADRFSVCENSMVPHMLGMYMNDSISHGFANFEIAAGLEKGKHIGPPFHDGDFYKMLEAAIVVYSENKDAKLGAEIDSIISVIGKTQRPDGYIHTPVVIEQLNSHSIKNEFDQRLDFETYNMGHLMTAACVHYRTTGKKTLLNIAIKATDFLYKYYKEHPQALADNAICPSHYMGVTEMYRTTHDPRYLELAKGLIDIRGMVKDGTDHNQDRIPFRQQTKAVGHAVRANYLYAGVADVYAETGDESLMKALDAIWDDVTQRKMYITGACGALYDGVSPNGTTYDPSEIQQVHQAYGQDYQLPNLTAHNESCANIGNILWNWRMLLATGQAKYADVIEQVMYNSLLAGVSLDGIRYFYTNPLAVSKDLPYTLRWSKDREPYISYCNCCPPNTIRTVAEIDNYMYSLSPKGLWVNFYGGNKLQTVLDDHAKLEVEQVTDYPWSGNIKLIVHQAPKKDYALHLRVPGWSHGGTISVNGEQVASELNPGTYFTLQRTWKKGDEVKVHLPMKVDLIEANPLVEETRNQVAVRRGPVVYCVESVDLPDSVGIYQVALSTQNDLKPTAMEIDGAKMMGLKGDAYFIDKKDWGNQLYRTISTKTPVTVPITLIPYYAWDNRGKDDMSVWIPVNR